MSLQSQQDTWWHWLYTNAPAAWISALIALTSLLVVLKKRKRAKRIVIQEVSRSSLIRIWPTVRRKIQITFDSRTISTLGQIDLELFNEGSEFIDTPELILTLPEGTRVLDTHTSPEDATVECQIEQNKVSVRLPYLNPLQEHHQMIRLSLLVDGSTAPVRVAGGGQGWSLRHCRLPSPKRRFWSDMAEFILVWTVLVVSFPYMQWAQKRFGVGDWEVSWRVLYLGTPLLVPLVMAILLSYRRRRRESKRRRAGWADA